MFKKFPLLVYVPSKIVHDAILGSHASFYMYMRPGRKRTQTGYEFRSGTECKHKYISDRSRLYNLDIGTIHATKSHLKKEIVWQGENFKILRFS